MAVPTLGEPQLGLKSMSICWLLSALRRSISNGLGWNCRCSSIAATGLQKYGRYRWLAMATSFQVAPHAHEFATFESKRI